MVGLPLLASWCLLSGATADNVLVRPWGENALRVQISPSSWELTDSLPTAYLPGAAPGSPDGHFSFGPSLSAVGDPVTSGNIRCSTGSDGLLTVTRVSDSRTLLKESGRVFKNSRSSVSWDFTVKKLFGLGQNRHQNNGPGLALDVINETYSFQDSIGEEGGPSNSLPWTIGADPTAGGYQFGILFNSPSLGGVSFNNSTMTWSIIGDADNQTLRRQFDFLITTHAANAKPAEKPFQIIEKYVDAVGHARKQPFPGYWHSKNRYASQQELLDVARGFHNRSIPVDVIVIDWFHWKIMGDWSFNEQAWPDPKAMVEECRSYGMEIMVSVWPFTCPGSRSYDTLIKNNWVTTYLDFSGKRTNLPIETHGKNCRLVDATNPDFRKYAWSLIESGYYQYGIKIFWLDASEPEGSASFAQNASWSLGSMRDMGSLFTLYWTQAFYDGLRSHGETDIVMLPRAGWVGTWRHGGVLWSGDIGSTMDVLRGQVNIGLSAQMSGIPWWTTDVGGYSGGHAEDPTYRETIVRWFQYGMTCPLFRQHGARDHTAPWFYGPQDEKMLGDIIKLRASMKPYFSAQFDKLNETGRPFNRPLSWDFPWDLKAWEISEKGIGNRNSSSAFTPAEMQDGDFVELVACNNSAWNQQWKIDNSNGGIVILTDAAAQSKCLDNGGHPGHQPPQGPYPIHMWTCNKKWASAQTWVYNAQKKSFADPAKKNCLTTGTGAHPGVDACDPADSAQQWSYTAGGVIKSESVSKCLGVFPFTTQSVGADQYMMGDDYMAAPILNLGQRSRDVYFPKGADWVHHYTGKKYSGGTIAAVDAPLETFPLFKRA